MKRDQLELASETYHMPAEEFRRRGRQVVDWIADYMQRVEELSVLSRTQPGEIRRRLPAEPPGEGEPFDRVLHDLDEILLPGITHWQSPNFFAFFPANNSGPSILGELLSAGLGVQGMLWATSPSCTELETHVLDWLVGMLDLPSSFRSDQGGGGVIQDTASSASLCALLAAREKATQFETNVSGAKRDLAVYVTNQTHSSVQKAVRIAGIGDRQLRTVDVDSSLAMVPEALEATVKADLRDGVTPCFVCATTGTTASNAFDPIRPLGEICRRYGIWLHVDAAMSGTAALCPEFRWIHEGLELADSYCFNPHKWMFTNFDCDCFYVADRAALIRALSILPEYLKNQATASGAVIDYRDWQIPLGRRFRALKLWFVIRHYGVRGLQHHVRRHVELAQWLAGEIREHPSFELAHPPPLNLVCFRHKQGDETTQRILDSLNQSGRIYLTHARLQDKLYIRFCVAQTHTEAKHVQRAWELICRLGESS